MVALTNSEIPLNISYRVSLEMTEIAALVDYRTEVGTGHRTMATQKNATVIREKRTHNSGQLWVRGAVAHNAEGWTFLRPASTSAAR